MRGEREGGMEYVEDGIVLLSLLSRDIYHKEKWGRKERERKRERRREKEEREREAVSE